MDGKPNTGFDMWRDYTHRYGVAAAYCVCWRYLDMQFKTDDESEQEFCRQLRSAIAAEPTLTEVGVYRYNEAFAKLDGSMYKYDESLRANRQCAGDIDSVMDACEYGDGSIDYAAALKALTVRYGVKRLRFVLGCEVIRDSVFGNYPDDFYKWAQKMKIHESFGSMNVRTRPKYLTGLIAEVMEQENNIQKQGGLSLKSKNEFYIAFYERLALQGFQAFVPYSKDNIADICENGGNIAYLTKADTIEANPYAEGVDPATIERIREIARETALTFGICTEKPYNEGIHKQLPDGSYRLAEFDNTVLACVHHPILGYVFSTFNQPPKAVQSDECQRFYDKANAMRDFAIKSGLVDGQRIFSDEEMATIHNGLLKMRIALDSDLSFDESVKIDAITHKIETVIPELGGYEVYAGLKNELSEGVEP